MVSVLNVTARQISNIKAPERFVELLRRLLHAEARANGIARRGISVPAQITVSDEGEDARIEWQNGPPGTDYLPARVTMFQSKATSMPRATCAKEVRNEDGTLKAAIKNALDAQGAYIIFCTDECRGNMLRERIEGIRDGISTATKNGYPGALIYFYDANKISDWVNSHPSVASWALTEIFHRPVTIFQSWESWSKNSELKATKYAYIAGRSIDGRLDLHTVMADIPRHLSNPRSVARIVGLSGLGKTRVALEMFRPPKENNPINMAETSSVIYTTAPEGKQDTIKLLHEIRAERLDGIVIVDDCDLELHSTLAKIVQHPESNFSLLTLDYDPSAVTDGTHYVKLLRLDDDSIKGILKQAYPGLQDPEIGRICDFAQGFPRIAVLLGEASIAKEGHVIALRDDLLLRRLVWGRDQIDDIGHRVLAGCSLFDNIGVAGAARAELEFMAESICGVPWQRCYEWIGRFEKRQLIQQRGDYIQVLPKPLALRLAGERWSALHPDEAKKWFSGAMPERMRTTLCDQLALLDFHPSAQSIVDDLCGPKGPFSDPEVLSTDTGSRCFRSLVETNPEATINALERAFGAWTTEQLLDVRDGRRHLVWALEKLCFRRETFHRAARLLLAFAVAENETWGNNATGQFIHIYQLLLSGTEATGDEKLSIIDEALQSGDSQVVRIAIDALDHGLTTWHFSRTMGAEKQGSGRLLKDWQPTRKEALEYFRGVLSRLKSIAVSDSEFARIAKDKIAKSVRSMVNAGLLDEAIVAIEAVIARHGAYWAEALDGVSDVLEYDSDKMPKDVVEKVKALYRRLLPQSLNDRLKFYVTELPWDFTYGDEKKKDVERTINELAQECANEPDFAIRKLPEWLTGSHRQFYAFGRKLGELFPQPEQLIRAALEFLTTTSAVNTSASFLGAFLAGIQKSQPRLVNQTLDKVAAEPTLNRFLVDLTRFVPIGEAEIGRIVPLIRSGRILPVDVRLLAYGSVLATLPPDQLDPLLAALQQRDAEGVWAALDIVSMYLHGRKDRIPALKNRIVALLKTPGLLSQEKTSVSDDHHFEVLAKVILDDENSGAELARHLASEIVAVCKLKSFPYNRDHLIKKLMDVLFAKHVRDAWPPFRDAIAENNPLTQFHLEHVLGAGFDKDEGRKGVLFTYSDDELLNWCREAPEVAPAFLAKIVPLLLREDDKPKFSPFVMRLLDEFGKQKDILSAIASNMHSFSSVGSRVPYYETRLKALESLLTHRHKEVRDFARKEIAALKTQIEHERKRDQEHDFGIF